MLRQLVSMLMQLLLCHLSFLGFLLTPVFGCCWCSVLAFYFQLCVIVFAAVAASAVAAVAAVVVKDAFATVPT